MSRILICPAEHADDVAAEYGPSHVVTLATPTNQPAVIPGDPKGREGDPGDSVTRLDPLPLRFAPAGDDSEDRPSLHLSFNDIITPRAGLVAPSRADIVALLAFAHTWDCVHPLLVHCRMGISRSTAAALIVSAIARPRASEEALAQALRAVAPCATPNALMVALADDLLGRDGRLMAAVRAIGRGADYAPYRLSVLDLDAIP